MANNVESVNKFFYDAGFRQINSTNNNNSNITMARKRTSPVTKIQ
jgi:hypothetical protein